MIAGRRRPAAAALLLAAALLQAVGAAPAPPEADRRLVVEIDGLKSNKGTVALALFDDREAFDRKRDPLRSAFVTPRRKRARWVLEGLPPGEYALVAYHDRNDNRELDRGKPFGIPTEPYGFSNDARGAFGPPSFEAARFEVAGGATKITIRLR